VEKICLLFGKGKANFKSSYIFLLEVKRRVPKEVGESGSLNQRPLVICHLWKGVI
jgi:hypothetical protein